MANCDELAANSAEVTNGFLNAASGDVEKSSLVIKVDRPEKVVGALESFVHFRVHTVVR